MKNDFMYREYKTVTGTIEEFYETIDYGVLYKCRNDISDDDNYYAPKIHINKYF